MPRKKSSSYSNGNSTKNGSSSKLSYDYKKGIVLTALTPGQKEAIKAIKDNDVTILTGPAGSGKSHIATIYGLSEVLKENYRNLMLTRPCIEAYGEELGFLPGTFNQKIAPYMIPIFDIIYEYIDVKVVEKMVSDMKIITLPLAFQRGVSFNNSFVVFDEAQNAIPNQFRMFLTRIGNNSKVVITGDPNQSDRSENNGLIDACERLEGVKNLKVVRLTEEDVVRNPIVVEIDKRYSKK